MTEKNKKKEELKQRRKPPIPYSRKGKTKKDVLMKAKTKYKSVEN